MCEDIKVVKCSICGTTEKVMPEIEKEPICQTCFREVKTQQPRGKRLGASRTFDEIEEALQLPGRLLEIKVNHWRETVEIITEIDKELIQQAEVSDQKVADGKVLADCLAPLKGFVKLEQVQLDGEEIKPGTIKPTEISAEGKEFWTNLKQGIVKGSIVEGKESKTLSEVQLDESEIKPRSIKPEGTMEFVKGGSTHFDGIIKIKCHTPDELTKEQIAEIARQAAEESMNKHKHLLEDLFADVHVSFKTDLELMTEVRRLRKLLEIERSARSDLLRLKEQFANDPLLFLVYTPSAAYALEQATMAIDKVFNDLLGEGDE